MKSLEDLDLRESSVCNWRSNSKAFLSPLQDGLLQRRDLAPQQKSARVAERAKKKRKERK